jgi:hypothetical protein
MVKLMNLGIIGAAAIATGVGLLRGRAWARKAMYVMFTDYSCLAISVASMGIVMNLHSDPDASPALTGGFVIFALIFVTLRIPGTCCDAGGFGEHVVTARGDFA